jgi:beta-lactamase class A
MLHIPSLLRKFLRLKVPSYLYASTTILLVAIIFYNYQPKKTGLILTGNEPPVLHSSSAVSQIRLNDYDLIKPLLYADNVEEDPALKEVKANLSEAIKKYTSNGQLASASIYLKKMNETMSININSEETYNPGSMMKLPVMIAYFKEAMSNPSLLNKKILFPGHNTNLLVEEGSKTAMKPGQTYSIKKLIEYMIIESDNDAMALLVTNIDNSKLEKLYEDLKIPVPDKSSSSFELTPIIYGRFLRVLYNSTYLDRNYSHMALSILTQTKYQKGLTRSIDSKIKVAHKYGISTTGEYRSLSEAGIFYSNEPYIFVIMTKGYDYNKLSDIIDECSVIVSRQNDLNQ